jgi:hypothetical protein
MCERGQADICYRTRFRDAEGRPIVGEFLFADGGITDAGLLLVAGISSTLKRSVLAYGSCLDAYPL